MNNLIKSSLVLLLFSASLCIFQLSCKKDATAQNSNYVLPPATNSTLGGIIVGSGLSITSTGVLSVNTNSSSADLIVFLKRTSNAQYEIWSADGNGGNQKIIPVTLPAGYSFTFGLEGGQLKLSYDKTKIYFTASNTNSSSTPTSIFSCSISGTNVTKIIDGCYYNFDVR
jgi:hypothetical protein